MKRQSKNVCPSLEHGLNLYALAASAAGVSLLALAQPAEARIVYTHAHHVFQPNTMYNLDLNHDGTRDFVLSDDFRNTSAGTGAVLRAVGPSGNKIAVSATHGYALALGRGAKIGGSLSFRSGIDGLMAVVSTGTGMVRYRGNWTDATNRYLGVKFSIGGKAHYGWARLTVHTASDPAHLTATLTGYAYETIPNKTIIAGQTAEPGVVAFQPATLGRLAQGESGLSAWRSKKGSRR